MKLGVALLIMKDLIQLLEDEGILLADGEFDQSMLDTLQENLEFATKVEHLLEVHSIHIPDRVGKIIQLLPLIEAIIR